MTEFLNKNFKGKLEIKTLIDLPVFQFPVQEVCVVRYVVGHYVGTSFRVLCRCSSYEDANRIASAYENASYRKCEIFKSIINLQKI